MFSNVNSDTINVLTEKNEIFFVLFLLHYSLEFQPGYSSTSLQVGHLYLWPKSKWDPSSFSFVKKTMLLLLLAEIESRKITDRNCKINCKKKLFVETY